MVCVPLGYIVEKCEDGSSFWEEAPGVVKGEKHVIKGLDKGKKYKFRVKAENPYGKSEPAETEKSTLAKNPYGQCYTYRLIYIYIN